LSSVTQNQVLIQTESVTEPRSRNVDLSHTKVSLCINADHPPL